MGYLHTRRYVIDAENISELRDLALLALEKEYSLSGDDLQEFLKAEDIDLEEMSPAQLTEIITGAADVGNLTSCVLVLDEFVSSPGQNVRPYFPKYTLDDIRNYPNNKSPVGPGVNMPITDLASAERFIETVSHDKSSL